MTKLTEKKQDKYLTVKHVAEVLGCSEQFVYKLVKQGDLKALRLGVRAIRISEKSLNNFAALNIIDPDEYFDSDEAKNLEKC